MANKTAEKISPDTFLNEMNAINNKAKDAAIDLLSKQGDKRYIVVMDWEDSYTEYYTYKAAISVSVFGVGLNEDNSLCIAATVDNQGYGCSEECFAQDWVEVSELDRPCYALLYRFVANNIDKAVTKDEADRLAKKYWNGNGFDSGKYDWEDVFICNGFVKVKLDGKFGFINEDGVEIISCKYEDACDFSDGLARVKSEEGWGFVNEDGEEIISCKYEYATSFSDGLARVKSEEGCGFINKDGEEIIPCKYEEVYGFSDGLAGVKSEEGWGFINKDGEEIIPCKYENAKNFWNGLAIVKSEEGWGFINKDGEGITPCKYEDADAFSDGLAKVKSAEGWGFVNEHGEEIIPCKYEDADAFSDGLAKVKSAEGWGFVNEHGEEIIPCKYEVADYFWFGADTAEVKLNGEWINIDKTGKQVTEEN